ncbi:AbrB/MazE/SpoVT family DNA-binding domain-containing protein [Candidatus Gracilibacteria bacterium]|nr:AbrB/MazE/SpoVT family DNA-binding domain-containing protein [Candidatus Gracilibacteria bacterium]
MEEKKCSHLDDIGILKLGGVLTIGAKGQIVIPKEIRDALDINPSDSVAIFYSLEKKHIGIVKNDNLEKVIEFAKNKGINIEI